jgi:hypothetical protein
MFNFDDAVWIWIPSEDKLGMQTESDPLSVSGLASEICCVRVSLGLATQFPGKFINL